MPHIISLSLQVLRLGLSSLGSLGWASLQATPTLLPSFLLSLRALLRSSLAVAVVTVPHHVLASSPLAARLQLCSDFVLELESFETGEVRICSQLLLA